MAPPVIGGWLAHRRYMTARASTGKRATLGAASTIVLFGTFGCSALVRAPYYAPPAYQAAAVYQPTSTYQPPPAFQPAPSARGSYYGQQQSPASLELFDPPPDLATREAAVGMQRDRTDDPTG